MKTLIASTWDGDSIPSDERATVTLEFALGGDLRVFVHAPLHGDPPPPGPPGPTPGLWEYEVVELFVAESAPDDSVRYLEIELSPHGHHLVLRLQGVRNVVEQGFDLDYRTQIDAASGRWSGEAVVPVAWLPPTPHRVNAFALHGRGDARRYLAWSPLPGRCPDFHQPGRFPRVEIDLSGQL